MKIGTVISIFEDGWEEKYAPLRDCEIDHFELLIENSVTLSEVAAFCKNRSVIFHAPFIDLNLINQYPELQKVSLQLLKDRLSPFVNEFHPEVITLHCGYTHRYYQVAE